MTLIIFPQNHVLHTSFSRIWLSANVHSIIWATVRKRRPSRRWRFVYQIQNLKRTLKLSYTSILIINWVDSKNMASATMRIMDDIFSNYLLCKSRYSWENDFKTDMSSWKPNNSTTRLHTNELIIVMSCVLHSLNWKPIQTFDGNGAHRSFYENRLILLHQKLTPMRSLSTISFRMKMKTTAPIKIESVFDVFLRELRIISFYLVEETGVLQVFLN